jgi:hypothetical protein
MATQTIPAYDLNYGSKRHSEQVADRNYYLFAAQQRARRGPTPEVFSAKRLDNSRLVKAADPVRVREMRIFTAAMTVMFVIVMSRTGNCVSPKRNSATRTASIAWPASWDWTPPSQAR